ncbi:hypothetical protein M0R72_16690 [Candidatus Pacearchaeota archaeon]|jgi:hypothetical protein|nr:hypothetical protein [Candidatus Pacearchaeota archaeon]
MANKSDGNKVADAVALIEREYMDVSELQKTLNLKSYQYARQMLVQDRYGLGSTSIECMGRKLVSREAVAKALQIREEHRLEASRKEASEPLDELIDEAFDEQVAAA